MLHSAVPEAWPAKATTAINNRKLQEEGEIDKTSANIQKSHRFFSI
jgi:hypothetical protein